MEKPKLETKEEQEKHLLEMARLAEKVNHTTCDKCYGRGYDGFDIVHGYYTPCICVVKAVNKLRIQETQKVPHETLPEENN